MRNHDALSCAHTFPARLTAQAEGHIILDRPSQNPTDLLLEIVVVVVVVVVVVWRRLMVLLSQCVSLIDDRESFLCLALPLGLCGGALPSGQVTFS
eukprot:977166-Pelagomonas_calceolata.AAC.2